MNNGNFVRRRYDFTRYAAMTSEQLVDVGKSYIDSNNYQEINNCQTFIHTLLENQKYDEAITVSEYLFDKYPHSPKHLHILIKCVVEKGDTTKQKELAENLDNIIKENKISCDRNVYSIRLKLLNNLIELGLMSSESFYSVYNDIPSELKKSNTFIIQPYFFRLNSDERYAEVVNSYNELSQQARANDYVMNQYRIAVSNTRHITPEPITSSTQSSRDPKGIFIVFGRNEDMYNKVKSYLECFDTTIISLRETGTEGCRTITEQVDSHINSATYAVVLLTPDDIGQLADDTTAIQERRTRENVMYEFGYVCGNLKRENCVCIELSGQNLHLPTDVINIRRIMWAPNDKFSRELNDQLRRWGFTLDSEKFTGLIVS